MYSLLTETDMRKELWPVPGSPSEGMIENAGGKRAGSGRGKEKALLLSLPHPADHPPAFSIIRTE